MPDRRTHRGPHPEDARLFAPQARPLLRQATADLCWLLDRGYPPASSLKLVGDRYSLVSRQRIAVSRCACDDAAALRRREHQVRLKNLLGCTLELDGYNVLTTIEAALAGGVLLVGRDGTYRDMASMHGSYRKVAETAPALQLLGEVLADLGVGQCRWFLDRPVSNSGRLKAVMAEIAAAQGWPWEIELVDDPDGLLAESEQIVATADSAILDRCGAWFNLARQTVARRVPTANVLVLWDEQQ